MLPELPACCWRGQQIPQIAELSTETCVALPPQLEAAGDRSQQLRFFRGLFLGRGSFEKTAAHFSVPADVVPAPHLIFKEPGEHEALRTCGFHHSAVVQRRRAGDKTIVHRAQIGRRREFIISVCRDLRKVREHAGVVQELVPIDRGLGHVAKPDHEELQCPAVVASEQFLEQAHTRTIGGIRGFR